jgi:hypothetical protein
MPRFRRITNQGTSWLNKKKLVKVKKPLAPRPMVALRKIDRGRPGKRPLSEALMMNSPSVKEMRAGIR